MAGTRAHAYPRVGACSYRRAQGRAPLMDGRVLCLLGGETLATEVRVNWIPGYCSIQVWTAFRTSGLNPLNTAIRIADSVAASFARRWVPALPALTRRGDHKAVKVGTV